MDTGASLNLLQTTVNLPGTGNEATGGLFSNFILVAGGLFTEQITPAQLQMASQVAGAGLSASAYHLNVTVGGDSTIVGGTLGNFTTTGNSSNFIIEDTTLLGLTAAQR